MVDTRVERDYGDALEAANSSQFPLQTYVKGIGHCNFTSTQLLVALAAMERGLPQCE